MSSDYKEGHIQNCIQLLRQSGFYWGAITNQEAKTFLRNAKAGSFLVRDSTDQRYLFTITLKTSTGITSVRIVMQKSTFRLDSKNLEAQTPTFKTVLHLINYYMKIAWNIRSSVTVEQKTTKNSSFLLYHPLYKELYTLKHLCRRAINNYVTTQEKVYELPVSSQLQDYLCKWPFSC